MLERFHKECANLARVHACTPVQAVKYYRTPEMRQLFTGRAPAMDQEPDYGLFDDSIRAFEVGDIVSRFIPRRSRTKAADVYSLPMRVVRKMSDRNYSLWNGRTRLTVHVDDIKRVVVPAALGWVVRPALLGQFCLEWQVDSKALECAGDPFAEVMRVSWKGRCVLVPPAFRQIPAILRKVAKDKPEFVGMVVPHLPVEE